MSELLLITGGGRGYEARSLELTYLHGVLHGSLQLLTQSAGLLLHLGVRLAELLGGLLEVSARLLQSGLGLAVGVVQL